MSDRDNFSEETKKKLAARVGHKCSLCGTPTSQPDSKSGAVNLGEASHICAASKNGPRYDEYMTEKERKSLENGIWLCRNCAKKIDSDVEGYPVEFLYLKKMDAEDDAVPIKKYGFCKKDLEKLEYIGAILNKENVAEMLVGKELPSCFSKNATFELQGLVDFFLKPKGRLLDDVLDKKVSKFITIVQDVCEGIYKTGILTEDNKYYEINDKETLRYIRQCCNKAAIFYLNITHYVEKRETQ